MAVQLELVGGMVTFSPPLTPHSSLPSIPEIVAVWMNSYVATTRHLPRILPNSKVSGKSCCCCSTRSTRSSTYMCALMLNIHSMNVKVLCSHAPHIHVCIHTRIYIYIYIHVHVHVAEAVEVASVQAFPARYAYTLDTCTLRKKKPLSAHSGEGLEPTCTAELHV